MDETTDWVAGRLNGALDFDGSDDYVSLGANVFGNLGDNHSVSVWLKYGGSGSRILTEWQSGVCGDFLMDVSGGDLGVGDGGGGGSVSSNTLVQTGVWEHWVFVSEENDAHIYHNGVLDISKGSDVNWRNTCSAQDVIIGANVGGGNAIDAQIDDVRVHNRALNEAEIKFLASPCQNPGHMPGTMLYNDDHNVLQYCNGENWIGIGK